MTHPTLGYSNFRFDGDDAVHMPATPTATMTVACRAGNDHTAADQPFEVDAAVTCPNCAQALEADWWMAVMENERRTGEVSSLSGTLEDVSSAMQRLLSQTDAVVEETLLGGGASLVEQPRPQPAGPLPKLVGDWTDLERVAPDVPAVLRFANQSAEAQQAFRQELINAATPVTVDVSQDYLFMEDKVSFRARRGDTKAYEHVERPVTPEKLTDAMESLARQLAASPLAALKRWQVRHGEWTMDVTPSLTQDVPLANPGAERVRRAIEEAEDVLAEHPFDEATPNTWQRLLQEASVIDADDDAPIEEPFGLMYSKDYPDKAVRYRNDLVPDDATMGELADRLHSFLAAVARNNGRNWCHVHNRVAEPGREMCSECDGEQGEERAACGPDCEHES